MLPLFGTVSSTISNPYTLGVAQGLAELPLFSGAGGKKVWQGLVEGWGGLAASVPLILTAASIRYIPDYQALDFLLTPRRPVRPFALENLSFWGRVLRALLTLGIGRVSTATLLGQYHTPDGFFYGGAKHEESTTVLMELYRRALAEYEQVVQMDMHTGYGPRYQMSVIVPPLETISSAEFSRKFGYPLVQKIDADEFYAISGDMGEYVYRLRDAQFPGKRLFACGFEFGTFGEALPARIRSLRAMVLENQLHWHGAVNKTAAQAVRREFEALYFPAEPKWREKAIADGRRAFEGILKAYRLV